MSCSDRDNYLERDGSILEGARPTSCPCRCDVRHRRSCWTVALIISSSLKWLGLAHFVLPLALCRSFSDLRNCTDENWEEMHSRRCQGCKFRVKLTETSCTACFLVGRSNPFSFDRLRMSRSLATKQWQGLVSMHPAALSMLTTCRLWGDCPPSIDNL